MYTLLCVACPSSLLSPSLLLTWIFVGDKAGAGVQRTSFGFLSFKTVELLTPQIKASGPATRVLLRVTAYSNVSIGGLCNLFGL